MHLAQVLALTPTHLNSQGVASEGQIARKMPIIPSPRHAPRLANLVLPDLKLVQTPNKPWAKEGSKESIE